jgi:hypothetical protein
MRSRRRFWWATSLALGSVVASGCAPAGSTRPDLGGLPGKISGQSGRPGLVIAAPHGTSDARTGEIATELGRRTGFGVVVATGFNLEPDARESPVRRYQVNRPLEGTPGRPASAEVASEGARQVYRAYEQRVREVAQGPLIFYAEIHGNNHRDVADRIEIATVGVDRDAALRLRTLLELIRDAHLRANREAPRFEIFVEPANTLRYAASSAKRDGLLGLAKRALHFELPKAARTDWREVYVAILADFLVQAVPPPAGR